MKSAKASNEQTTSDNKFAKDSIQHNNFFSAKKREGFDSPVGVDAR